MTVICSWCKDVLSEDETEDGEIISHAICEPCGKKLLAGEFEDANFPQPGLDPPPKTR